MKRIKEFSRTEKGIRINWVQDRPYRLGDAGQDINFLATIYDKDKNIVLEKVVLIPTEVLETWANDDIITNYILADLGVELDIDTTLDLILAKLNEGTITYASGTQEENDTILKTYATFIALNIESYKKGDIELSDIPRIQIYKVNVTSNSLEFDYMDFIANLAPKSDTEKTSVLNACVTAIESAIVEYQNPITETDGEPEPITETDGEPEPITETDGEPEPIINN